MRHTVARESSVTVHVRRRLLGQGLIAVLSLTAPVALVLYWLTIPNGPWQFVLAANLLVVAAVVFGIVQYFRVSVIVTPQMIIEKSFLGRTRRFSVNDIARAVLLDLHRTLASEPRRQLFVLDRSGRVLLRMRGDYWSTQAIHRVAEHLVTVPVEHVESALTLEELQRTNPSMLYWFERRPTRPS